MWVATSLPVVPFLMFKSRNSVDCWPLTCCYGNVKDCFKEIEKVKNDCYVISSPLFFWFSQFPATVRTNYKKLICSNLQSCLEDCAPPLLLLLFRWVGLPVCVDFSHQVEKCIGDLLVGLGRRFDVANLKRGKSETEFLLLPWTSQRVACLVARKLFFLSQDRSCWQPKQWETKREFI